MNTRTGIPISFVLILLSAVPYSHAWATDIVWKRIVSREIEVVESHPTTKHSKTKASRDIPLAEAMVAAIKEGKVTAYSNLDMSLTTRLSDYEMDDIMGKREDVLELTDPITGQTARKIIKHIPDYKKIHTYRILEEWTFNTAPGKTEIQILGIAPVRDVYGEDGIFRGVQAIFWLHYNDAQPILDKYDKQHPALTMTRRIWNDYFSPGAKPVIKEGIWQSTATRTIDMPIEKEDIIKHHLKDAGSDNTLLADLFEMKNSGTIVSYSNFQNGFINKLGTNEVNDLNLIKADTQIVTDPVTGANLIKVFKDIYQPNNNKVKIIENWSFNPVIGKTEIDIAGIAPLREFADSNDTKTRPMFWLQYADVSMAIIKYDDYHPKNNFATCMWDSYFISEVKPAEMK